MFGNVQWKGADMLNRFNSLIKRRNALAGYCPDLGLSVTFPENTPVSCLDLGTDVSRNFMPGSHYISPVPQLNQAGGFLWNGSYEGASPFHKMMIRDLYIPPQHPTQNISWSMDCLEFYLDMISSGWWFGMWDNVFVVTERKIITREFTGTSFYPALQNAASTVSVETDTISVSSLSSSVSTEQLYRLENKTNFYKQDWGNDFQAILEHISSSVRFKNPYSIPIKIKLLTQTLPVFSFVDGLAYNQEWTGRRLYDVAFGAERTGYTLDYSVALSNAGKYYEINEDGSLSISGTNELMEKTYLFEEVLQNITYREYEFTLEAGGEYLYTPPNNSHVDDFSLDSLNKYAFYNTITRFSYAVQPQF